ncbi:hypothetical protein [Mycolicibacterium fortuitum]|uniref:hypothetical protein n=1 Tax=Mycolicibacterium fortuitum TaxID=1766 RepID=UPI001F445BD1|nr:hypothetical protein [Mycolicibacterium fortuitum]
MSVADETMRGSLQTQEVVMKGVLIAAATVGIAMAVSPVASADPSWTMPNLIGMDLQGAQDAIQSLTRGEVWFSSSTDLTGKGRAQISDRNWQVCSSTPAPGAKCTASTDVDVGVVRVSEECP